MLYKYSHCVSFLFVYILEAHAIDEWPVLSVNDAIQQHKSVEDRLNAACTFLNDISGSLPVATVCSSTLQQPPSPSFDIVLDNEWNEFNSLLSSWPTRYWILNADRRVLLKCMPESGEFFSLNGLEEWLAAFEASMCSGA